MSVGSDAPRRRVRWPVAALLPLLPAFAAAADSVGEEFRVGDWSGRAYFDDAGQYDSCALYQSSRSDSRLFLRLANGELSIVLINLSWSLPVGVEHPVTLNVDDFWVRRAVAKIGTETATAIDLGRDRDAVDALRRGRLLTIRAPERTFRFGLDGSSAAIALMRDCDDRNGTSARVAEAPRRGPSVPDGGSSANPFAPAGSPSPPPASSNPFAPADPPQSAAAPSPSEIVAVPAGVPGGPRPAPARDGLQRIAPYLPFSAFALTVELFLPGEPEAWATPDDALADYQFRGATEDGAYRGIYLEVAPLGETAAETLYRFMWVAETVCDGLSRSLGGLRERFGDTEVARETIECQGPGGPVLGSTVVSHTAASAQVFVIDGGGAVPEVSEAVYRVLRGLAREG